MYPGIELRPLRYVIAVAQERHFARAALRVHVARSSLSKSIRDIEDYVGVPLFERTTREVELTPAGRAFIEDGARALTYAERAIHRARAANGTNNGSLSIGYSPRINLQLLSIIRELAAAQRPATNVAFVSLHTPDQLRALHEGAIQIGLVTLPLRDEFLALKALLREPLGVVFPSCHRLARGGDIDPKQLNGLPVVVTRRELDLSFHDHLRRLFRKAGYTPNVVQEVMTEAEALYMVSMGMGITFMKIASIPPEGHGISYRKLGDSSLVEDTGLAYRRSKCPEKTELFVRVLRQRFRQLRERALSGSLRGGEATQLKLL
ncbi:MAG: LysR substrate-binding domain-containing protein [Candidatus Acidiferrales bacterium]